MSAEPTAAEPTAVELAATLLAQSGTAFNEWREATGHPNLILVDLALEGADLLGVDWQNCLLARLNLREADLREASFVDAVVYRCDLTGAKLGAIRFGDSPSTEFLGLDADPASASSNPWLAQPVLPAAPPAEFSLLYREIGLEPGEGLPSIRETVTRALVAWNQRVADAETSMKRSRAEKMVAKLQASRLQLIDRAIKAKRERDSAPPTRT